MKKKKVLALGLAAAMAVSLTACGSSSSSTGSESSTASGSSASEASESTATDDPLSISDATVTELTPHLDGEEIQVTMYEDVYCASPNSDEQKISIYVPEGATADSPILFHVNNSGWQSDAYDSRTQVKSYGTEEQEDWMTGSTETVQVGDYLSDSDEDEIGAALSRGYVIVSYGCRARNDDPVDGKYLGHSPATITDTKAAIRYLRYNADDLPAGNTDEIIVTGTSGGGALSVDIAASGNSEDYFESLYEIGAAGIEQNDDGTYTSTIGDDVFATVAYCPINNLGPSDLAYEWTFYDARTQLVENGHTWTYQPDRDSEETIDVTDQVMAASKELHDAWPAYLESLGLTTEDGTAVTADNIDSLTSALMEKEIEEAIEEIGVDQMRTDMTDGSAGGRNSADPSTIDTVWLTLNDDGTYTYDYASHCYYLAQFTELKVAPAFSNLGLNISSMNEDSLFGTEDYQYSPYEFYSWNNDATADNGAGLDDTGMTWDEYMETEEGQALALQIKMASPIEYLLSDTDGDSAPHWYVRHGMMDRDTSFTNQTVLYYAMLDDESIEDLNFEYAWLKPHSGNYDVQEAYAWLDSFLGATATADTESAA